MNSKDKLILFTRYPEPGKTKTRLIPCLGMEDAAQLQKKMTEYSLSQARKTNADIECRYAGGSLLQMQEWLGEDLRYVEQGEGSLGDKMKRAFEDHFSSGAERVVIIGADCPSNTAGNMSRAFEILNEQDAVIGPAHDGGYYLIGLSKLAPQLFENIEWGGDQVFEQTGNAAADLALHLLPVLHDVDLPGDIPQKISVIIPTLNEAPHIEATLKNVKAGFNVEVLVVDGGSTDQTCEKVPDALICKNGRAAQLNMGAERAVGELLLFLHADTELPDGWEWEVRSVLKEPTVALGSFAFKIRDAFWGRNMVERGTNYRARKKKMPYGDQGLFIRKDLFQTTGGFPDIPIMEDYVFVRNLRKRGTVVISPLHAKTSGRRWLKHGVLKVTLVNQVMIAGYLLGIPPERLEKIYRK